MHIFLTNKLPTGKSKVVNHEPKPMLVARKHKTNPYIDFDSDADANTDFSTLFTWEKVDKGKAIDKLEGDHNAGLSPRVCY